jgi:GntR family transcriptional regulator / MocR family aminotransferase
MCHRVGVGDKPVVSEEMRWWAFQPAPGETLRLALERTIREAVLGGALRAGVRLPASRKLAADLGVSRGVVTDAYEQLTAQGFLVTHGRSAPLVAALARHDQPAPATASATERIQYDFTASAPDVSLFPLRRWLTTALKAAQAAPSAALGYGDRNGHGALRAALADHLGRTRGVIAGPDQIIITQGTSQAIDLVLGLLRARGARRVVVEDPSHTGQRIRILHSGLALVGQKTDEEGLIVEGLQADAVLLTPAHQFPSGVVLSPQRRRSLLEWAIDSGGLLIEDDYDAEFRYDREPVRAMQGLAPGCVIQLGTVSKTLAPALRLGWIVAPSQLAEELAFHKALADESSPTLDQLALAAFLRDGHYDRHVRKARTVYRARRDRLVKALDAELPGFQVRGIAAGIHVLLALPSWLDDKAVARSAVKAHIQVSPLSEFCLARADVKGLVLGYGQIHESALPSAVAALADIVRRHMAHNSGGHPQPNESHWPQDLQRTEQSSSTRSAA